MVSRKTGILPYPQTEVKDQFCPIPTSFARTCRFAMLTPLVGNPKASTIGARLVRRKFSPVIVVHIMRAAQIQSGIRRPIAVATGTNRIHSLMKRLFDQ